MMSNSVFNVLILSFLLLLSIECVRCQSLGEEIATLPACSTKCISKAAIAAKCGVTDFACQCLLQNSITTPAWCLIGDCGIANTTVTRSTFIKICSIISASSSSMVASVAPAAYAEATPTSSLDQPSTSTFDPVLSSVNTDVSTTTATSTIPAIVISDVPINPVLLTSVVLETSIVIQFSTPIPIIEPTIVASSSSSSSTSIPPSPITYSAPVPSTVEMTQIAVSVFTAESSSTNINFMPTSTLATSYTSMIKGAAGAAKMSPVAASNSRDPIQAALMPGKKTRPTLGAAAIVSLVVGAMMIMVAILGISFWYRRRRQMESISGRKLAVVEEETGPGDGTMSDIKMIQELEDGREKSLPLHPLSPRTPDLEESVFPRRESNLTLNFEYSPPPRVMTASSSQLQPTTYNSSQTLNVQPELSSSSSEAKQNKYQSMAMFVPSNPAHNSTASSFFASIPILLDSKEGRCEDCLNNQKKFRFGGQAADYSPPVCACASKHPESDDHQSPPTVGESRSVSVITISRPEAEDELLVNRVKTLMPEFRNSRESRASE